MKRLQQCFLGFPEEFEAPPLGESVYRNATTHVANGEAAAMVLYDFDFLPGREGLNVRGLDRLARIQTLLPRTFYPVVIERTPGCPQLAELRRLAVLNELARCSFVVPAERVVIGPPLANGLQGVEAEIIYGNQLRLMQSYGVPAGSLGGSAGFGTMGQGGTTSQGQITPPPQ
jgi:hypothetical protein